MYVAGAGHLISMQPLMPFSVTCPSGLLAKWSIFGCLMLPFSVLSYTLTARFCAEIDGIAESSCHIVAEDLEIGYGCRLLCCIDGVVLALKYLYRLDT